MTVKKPEYMKAAILVESGKPLVLDQVRLPESLEVGQVLVKIFYSGICGAQINEIDAVKGPDKFLPHLLGHEGSAKVLEVGPGVKVVSPGDRVVMHWRKGTGIQCDPPSYIWRERKLNSGWVTTFSDYSIVSENRITAIPDDFGMDIAPLFGCAVTTGFGVICKDAKVKIGESVVVLGAGGVGLNVIQGAAMVSAHPIIVVDLYENKLELAKKFGATHVINSSKVDPRAAILDILGGPNADVAVDNTGLPELIQLGYEITNSQGRVICVGVAKKGNNISIYSLPLHFGKVLTGSHGGDTYPTEDIPRYVKLYEAGKFKLKELISACFKLDDINLAIEKIRKGEIAGRCMIEM